MKDTSLTESVKDIIKLKLEVVDEFIKDYIEPLLDVGSPENLIGKKYEEWTPQDLQMLSQIYGDKLNDFIFNKAYKEVRVMEQAEKEL